MTIVVFISCQFHGDVCSSECDKISSLPVFMSTNNLHIKSFTLIPSRLYFYIKLKIYTSSLLHCYQLPILLAKVHICSSRLLLWYQVSSRANHGERKSWDARGPMIWDNFSIFRTNCAILTSYIRADLRTCRGLSRGCCHVV